MERSEIIRELNRAITRERGKSYDTFRIRTIDLARDCLDFIERTIDGPTIDPATGLAYCGCGGRAHVESGDNDKTFFLVECEKCEIATIFYPSKEKAIAAWNIAMAGRFL